MKSLRSRLPFPPSAPAVSPALALALFPRELLSCPDRLASKQPEHLHSGHRRAAVQPGPVGQEESEKTDAQNTVNRAPIRGQEKALRVSTEGSISCHREESKGVGIRKKVKESLRTDNEKGIWREGLESAIVWSARGRKLQCW